MHLHNNHKYYICVYIYIILYYYIFIYLYTHILFVYGKTLGIKFKKNLIWSIQLQEKVCENIIVET